MRSAQPLKSVWLSADSTHERYVTKVFKDKIVAESPYLTYWFSIATVKAALKRLENHQDALLLDSDAYRPQSVAVRLRHDTIVVGCQIIPIKLANAILRVWGLKLPKKKS